MQLKCRFRVKNKVLKGGVNEKGELLKYEVRGWKELVLGGFKRKKES